MNVPDWKALLDLPWLSWSIGGLIATTGLILLYRALIADRPRGRRRCPKCWYDMRGTPSLRCPECGHTPKSERRLHRTRRYWRWAVFAFLCTAAGVALAITPQVRRNGWISIVPTTALLFLMTRGSDGVGPYRTSSVVDNELYRRGGGSSLNSWQWAYVARNKCFNHRPQWPRPFLPVVIEWYVPRGLGDGVVSVQEIAPSCESSEPNERYLPILPSAIDKGAMQLKCRVDQIPKSWLLGQGGSQVEIPWKTRWEGMVRLPVHVVESMDEAMRPLRGPEWDARIRTQVRIEFFRYTTRGWDGPVTSELVGVRVSRDAITGLSDLATGFAISICRYARGTKYVVTEIVNLRFDPSYFGWKGWRLPDGSVPDGYVLLKADTINELRWEPDWYIVLRGDPELALRDWDKTAYWDGQITLTPDEVWIEGRDPVEDLQKPRSAKSP